MAKARTAAARRPGGRSARVREAVIAATLAELAEAGYAGLSLDAVAQRAEVHKTTVYRRWRTREQLVLDAMLESAAERVPVPDTGTLRGDLLALALSSRGILTSPAGEAVTRAVAGAAAGNPELAAAARHFWRERLALDAAIVERAIERGELAPGADPQLVIEAVLAPHYFRVLATGEKPSRAFIEQVVDLVVSGLTDGRG